MSEASVLPGAVKERPFSRSVTVRVPQRSPLAGLTPRKRELARAVCEYGAPETSRRHGIALSTLKTHLSAVYAALGVGRHDRDHKVGRMCFLLGKEAGRKEARGEPTPVPCATRGGRSVDGLRRVSG